MMSHSVDFRLRVERLRNGSLVAMLTGPHNVSAAAVVRDAASSVTSSSLTSLVTSRADPHPGQSSIGALYYVIAVVAIYGFSIILLIGSQIRKNKHDRGVARLMTVCSHSFVILIYRNNC